PARRDRPPRPAGSRNHHDPDAVRRAAVRTGWICRCRWRRSGRRASPDGSATKHRKRGFSRRARDLTCETGSPGRVHMHVKAVFYRPRTTATPSCSPAAHLIPSITAFMLPRLLLLAALLSLSAHADAAEGDEVIDRARAMMEEGERMREMIE